MKKKCSNNSVKTMLWVISFKNKYTPHIVHGELWQFVASFTLWYQIRYVSIHNVIWFYEIPEKKATGNHQQQKNINASAC